MTSTTPPLETWVFASKALPEYPGIAERFDNDEVSFDRAVATTMLALAGAESATIEHSFGSTSPEYSA